MPKLHLITYGCQMNEYDSERVAGLLRDERYELTETAQDADLILLNTCAIREKCEDKVFSRLGELKHLKRERPHVLIGVMGCMAQLWQGKIQERAPSVDLVFGSAAVSRVGELVARARATGAPVLETGEAPLVKITARPEAVGQLKAFVTVVEGCEKGCTFCVVPVTRASRWPPTSSGGARGRGRRTWSRGSTWSSAWATTTSSSCAIRAARARRLRPCLIKSRRRSRRGGSAASWRWPRAWAPPGAVPSRAGSCPFSWTASRERIQTRPRGARAATES